jgi:hypothetical protein
MTVAASAQSVGETNKQVDKEKGKPSSNPFRNERLKRREFSDSPIETLHGTLVFVGGIWVPESKDQRKEMVFPEQVKVTCTNSERTCEELKAVLEPMSGVVFVDIDQTIWPIISWDKNGLLASYGPEITASAASERCHRHVLTMTFASGAVSTSDIPTHEKGCEMFPETDSYRLVRGYYYIDTSPGNDDGRAYKDRPAKGEQSEKDPK